VVQGTIISAVLESAIDTELPGNIRAQVMRPVYSFDGSRVLMPSGTILIGQFNDNIDIAQKRVLIAWNRAITPEGKSIALGSIGTDTLGRSGTTGNVDNRYATKFGAAILISAITVAPSMLASSRGGGESASGTTVNVGAGNRLASGIGDTVGEQGSGMLKKYLSLPPVIRIPQGEEIRIFANRDLVFL
jgi:type IV secretion system protein VirB10